MLYYNEDKKDADYYAVLVDNPEFMPILQDMVPVSDRALLEMVKDLLYKKKEVPAYAFKHVTDKQIINEAVELFKKQLKDDNNTNLPSSLYGKINRKQFSELQQAMQLPVSADED